MQINVIGISIRNGKKFPIFKTSEIINISDKESHRRELSKKYGRELYLITSSIGCEYELPLSYQGDRSEMKVVPLSDIMLYLT